MCETQVTSGQIGALNKDFLLIYLFFKILNQFSKRKVSNLVGSGSIMLLLNHGRGKYNCGR